MSGKSKSRSDGKAGAGGLTHGKMPCPNCGAPLVIELAALFAGHSIDCGACGARLTINREESSSALEGLRKAQGIVDRIHGAKGG